MMEKWTTQTGNGMAYDRIPPTMTAANSHPRICRTLSVKKWRKCACITAYTIIFILIQ